MPRILVAPTTITLSDSRYGKSYNLLDNLYDETLRIDAFANEADVFPGPENVNVELIPGRNRISYHASMYQVVVRELRNKTVDLYHHLNLSYRWFNPVLLADLHGDTPVVIGPCQAGHAIMAEEFNQMVSHWIAADLPRWITDPFHSVVDATRDIVLDPPRMELFERTLEKADRIVVVHQEARDVYSELVDESKLRTIPLGVDPKLFEYSEPGRSEELVAIGGLRERKGYDILFRALGMVSDDFPDVHLHVFGEGPLEDKLHQQVGDLGLQSNVTFHGFVEQSIVRQHLQRARAFVHPSRSESFSLVRLEAMSTGCPVVVSDTSGAREMVRDGKEGFVVPRESPKAIAGAVRTILSDYSLSKAIGKQARKRVEQKYNWRAIGQEYVELYHSLIQ